VRRFPSSRLTAGERERIREHARDVEFPVGMRGYERRAVDRYVEQVNRLIAELEMSASPESAVRHALDEVSEETRELLQRAHEAADEITARSRSKADDRLQQAEQEAAAVRAAAADEALETRQAAERDVAQLLESSQREAAVTLDKARHEAEELQETSTREAEEQRQSSTHYAEELRETTLRETQELRETAARDAQAVRDAADNYARDLYRSTEFLWHERRRLVDDVGSVGQQLVDIAAAEARRFERQPEAMNGSLSADEPVDQTELAAASGSSTATTEEGPEPQG